LLARSASETFGDPQKFIEWVSLQEPEKEEMKRGNEAERDYPNSLKGALIDDELVTFIVLFDSS
jgi:hypothetical protein